MKNRKGINYPDPSQVGPTNNNLNIAFYVDDSKGKSTKKARIKKRRELYDKWKLPTPSCIAVFSFSLIVSFEE